MIKRLTFILVLLGLFCPGFCYASSPVLVDKIVAVVGKHYLTLYQLEQMCKPVYERVLSQKDIPPQEKEALKKQIQKRILESWIESTILQEQAEKYGLTVTPQEVNTYIKNEAKALGGLEKLKEFLKSQGKTLDSYEKELKKRLLEAKLVQILVHQKVLVTEDELKKAYQEYLKEFYANHPKELQYQLETLIVNGNETLANKCWKLAENGTPFEDLAKKFSSAVTFIPVSSYYKEELSPKILNVVKRLKQGEVSPLISLGSNHWVIVKLIKKGIPKPLPFSKIKKHLYKKLFQEKAEKFIKKWIEQLKAQRYIKIYL